MDDILSQILEACKLARELENGLRLSIAVAADAHYLLGSCEEVVAAFNKAIHGLRSHNLSSYAAQMLFGEASGSRMDSDAGEGSSRYMQAIGLLRDDNTFYAGRPPQLALEIQPMAAVGVAEFLGGSRYANTSSNADVETFIGGGGEARLAVEGKSSGRRPDQSLVQRSSRKRKEGAVTKRVPVLRTGNMEIPPPDGYTWKKYGQKNILHSSFPRSYYHCTHKSSHGCKAKKQVQKLDDDPCAFEVTYYGTHTCQTSPTPILIPTLVPSTSGDGNGDPRGGTPLMLQKVMQSITPQPTSIQLRNWFEGNPHSGEGGRHIDFPVADLADSMFNSGSSGSSMDVIFSPRQGK